MWRTEAATDDHSGLLRSGGFSLAEPSDSQNCAPTLSATLLRRLLNSRSWPTRMQKHASFADTKLPIHLKQVNKLRMDDIRRFISSHAASQLQAFDEAAEKFSSAQQVHLHPTRHVPEAELTAADVSRLQELGLITDFEGNIEHAQPLRVFTVVEEHKNRRRLIMHPWAWNEETEPVALALPTPRICIATAAKFDWALCADIAAFYQHILLPDPSHFVLNIGGRLYSPTTIPTGASFCPALAQVIASALLIATLSTHPACQGQAYIDNFRFLASSAEQLITLRSSFLELAAELGVVLNDIDDIVPVQRYTFLGLYYDHIAACVSAGEKIRMKLNLPASPTLRQVVQLFSRCAWLSYVLGLPLYHYYYIYKFLRRRAGTNSHLDAPAKPWSCLHGLFGDWILAVSQVKPLQEPVPLTNWTLVTDASNTGWGAVFFGEEVAVAAGPWPPSVLGKDISVLEMLAVQWGWRQLLAHRPTFSVAVHLIVDNTTVISVLSNQRSRSYILNAIAAGMPQFASVRYIQSRHNFADGLSRLWSSEGN